MAYQLSTTGDLFEDVVIDLGITPSIKPLATRDQTAMPSLKLCERVPDALINFVPRVVKIVAQPNRAIPGQLPDAMMPFGQWIVCDRFRRIIEDLEPEMHQFFSVSFVIGDSGAPFKTEEPYLFMNVLNFLPPLSVIDVDRIKGRVIYKEEKFPNGYIFRVKSINAVSSYNDTGLVLKTAVIGSRHIWRVFGNEEDGVRINFPNAVFLSDELGKRLENMKFTGIRVVHVPES
jgi:hypothetical protein